VGLLGEIEVNKPSSSTIVQAPQILLLKASRKGKEPALPAPTSEAGSVSDEADTEADDFVESADDILARQVAINVATTPPAKPIVQ
jgi:hypothetical protein